jgi:hypothetical protein
MPPREAFFAPNGKVAATAAPGRVCAELVAPYPPGIPVLEGKLPGFLVYRHNETAMARHDPELGVLAAAL